MENTRPLIVNLFGGPCCGKSSIAAGVFALVKAHDINAELPAEFPKDLVWEGRLNAIQNQYYVWSGQYYRVQRFVGQVDVVIVDSPTLLSVVYDKTYDENFKEIVVRTFKESTSLNFLLHRSKDSAYDLKGRIHTYEQSCELDRLIEEMLIKNEIDYIDVEANYHAINTVAKSIITTVFKKDTVLEIKPINGRAIKNKRNN